MVLASLCLCQRLDELQCSVVVVAVELNLRCKAEALLCVCVCARHATHHTRQRQRYACANGSGGQHTLPVLLLGTQLYWAHIQLALNGPTTKKDMGARTHKLVLAKYRIHSPLVSPRASCSLSTFQQAPITQHLPIYHNGSPGESVDECVCPLRNRDLVSPTSSRLSRRQAC